MYRGSISVRNVGIGRQAGRKGRRYVGMWTVRWSVGGQVGRWVGG